jgi:hypothetical protein
VVYNVSKYAVVYSANTHTQRVFSGHTHEILSLQLHPSKEIVATGEVICYCLLIPISYTSISITVF